jgi:hypothetical protein
MLPLRRLGRAGGDDGRGADVADEAAVRPGQPGTVAEPSVPGTFGARFTSAEDLEAEGEPGFRRRTA